MSFKKTGFGRLINQGVEEESRVRTIMYDLEGTTFSPVLKQQLFKKKSVLYISLYFFQRFGYFSGQPPLFVNAINIIIFLICRHRFQQRGYYSGKQWVQYCTVLLLYSIQYCTVQ